MVQYYGLYPILDKLFQPLLNLFQTIRFELFIMDMNDVWDL